MLFVRWSVALPAGVIERAGVLGSLRRSRDLTRGHRWASLGVLMSILLVDGALFSALGFGGLVLARAVGASLGIAAGRVVIFVLGLVTNAAVVTINGASGAALYSELRRVGEGTLSPDVLEAFS